MKKRHLAAYDYGMGGLYVLAASRDAITPKYLELVTADEVPSWMPGDLHEKLLEEPEDVDDPGFKLAAIRAGRVKRAPEAERSSGPGSPMTSEPAPGRSIVRPLSLFDDPSLPARPRG